MPPRLPDEIWTLILRHAKVQQLERELALICARTVFNWFSGAYVIHNQTHTWFIQVYPNSTIISHWWKGRGEMIQYTTDAWEIQRVQKELSEQEAGSRAHGGDASE